MKSLIAATLFLAMLCGAYAAATLTYSLQQPAGSKLPPTFMDGSAYLPWGLSWSFEVTPEWDDLVSTDGTAMNNTDLVYSFTSFPGILLFTPSTITFRVTTNIAGTLTGASDVVFSPSSQIVRYCPVNMDASFNDPIWDLNITATGGNPIVPYGENVAMQWTESCFAAGSTTLCPTTTASSTNITTFVQPSFRQLVWNYDFEDHMTSDGSGLSLSNGGPINLVPFQPSQPFFVTLPLQDGTSSSTSFDTSNLFQGTASGDVAYHTPGRDNAGGTLTISVYSVWRTYFFPNLTAFWEQMPVSTLTMIPPSVTIDANTPSATFIFDALPACTVTVNGENLPIEDYFVYWRIVETSTTPSLASDDGFPLGAYLMSRARLRCGAIEFDISFDDSIIPVSPRKTGSYRYVTLMSQSPEEIGMGPTGTVTYPFQINPAGAMRILVATDASATSFVPVTEFVWTGSQRLIEFILDTQDTPTDPLGVNLTFSDPIFSTPRDLNAFDLLPTVYHFDIVANEMHVSITNPDNVADGVTPNQPFFLNFEWTPPTTNGFVLTVQANGVRYPNGATTGNITFTIAAGQSGFLAGPFYALVPTNLDVHYSDVSVIPINIGISALPGAAATDDGWFRVDTPVLLRVRRDRIYLVNNPITYPFIYDKVIPEKREAVNITGDLYNLYQLSAGGFVSEPFCVGVSLNSHFFADGQQEVWVTPWSETLITSDAGSVSFENRSGLIFTAVNNPVAATGVSRAGMPPGTVVLSRANNGTGCFTVAFDRNWQFLSSPLNTGAIMIQDLVDTAANPTIKDVILNGLGFWRIQAAIGGPDTGLVFERGAADNSTILRFPSLFMVSNPTIQWAVLGSVSDAVGDYDYYFYAGDSGLVYVTLSEPAQLGLNYAITCTACVLTQVDVTLVNGLPGFVPGSQGPHVWSITFDAVPKPFSLGGKRALAYSEFATTMKLWTYGADAAYFVAPDDVRIALEPRSISIEAWEDELFIGLGTDPIAVQINRPVLNGITVVPVPTAGSNALTFTPASITFTPDSPHVQHFTVSVDSAVAPFLFGVWSWTYRLEGPDTNITVLSLDLSGDHDYVEVVPRPTPLVTFERPSTWVAGVEYGPVDIKLMVPVLPGENEGITITASSGGGFVFTPSSVTFLPGQFQQTLSVRWDPTLSASAGLIDQTFFSLSGVHAWKFGLPVTPTSSNKLVETENFEFRLVTISLPEAPVGSSVVGSVALSIPTPGSFALTPVADFITFTPATLQFTNGGALVQHFTYVVDTDFPLNPTETATSIPVLFLVSGADAPYYESGYFTQISVRKHRFDLHTSDGVIENVFSMEKHVFMLNHPSPMYTLTASAPPQSSVTVTFDCDYLEFSPAALTFGPGVLTQSFSFTPIRIPPQILNNTGGIDMVSVLVSGPDADFYFNSIQEVFAKIYIIPEIDISPIPAIYTDGSSGEIAVTIKDAGKLSPGLPADAGAYNGFTLHIYAAYDSVLIQPNVLEFSSFTTGAIRKFTISHLHPEDFVELTAYPLFYEIRFGGESRDPGDSNGFETIPNVPKHARQVVLKRYNIIPHFPKVLSFGWQEASFNLTRAPAGHMTLIPHMPIVDGQDGAPYGGHATAGGRIHFDPPVIAFAPGQMVQTFEVKAMRGIESGAEALYYRVEWEMVGHEDDLSNFVEYVSPRNSNQHTHFATWHVAGAMCLKHISIALIALAALLLAL